MTRREWLQATAICACAPCACLAGDSKDCCSLPEVTLGAVRIEPNLIVIDAARAPQLGRTYAMCPEPYPPNQGVRQRFIWLGPTFPGAENSNFRREERRFDFGIRCAK